MDVGEEDVFAGLGKALMRIRQKKALWQMINSNDNLQAWMAMRAMSRLLLHTHPDFMSAHEVWNDVFVLCNSPDVFEEEHPLYFIYCDGHDKDDDDEMSFLTDGQTEPETATPQDERGKKVKSRSEKFFECAKPCSMTSAVVIEQ